MIADYHTADEKAKLETRIAELEQEVERLRGDPSAAQQLRRYGFNPRQARMLLILAQRSPALISREAIAGEGFSTKGIDVLVCKTRRSLKKIGAVGIIETVHGQGYRASSELTSWVLDRIKPQTDEG